MLNVVLGYKAPSEPDDEQTCKIEGWMLGKTTQHETPTLSKRPRASPIVSLNPSRRERRRLISLGSNSFESMEGFYSGVAAAGRV